MTIDEAIAMIDGAINLVEDSMKNISEEVALNALALITNRIQQEGLPNKPRYSSNKVPAFLYLLDGGRKLDTEQTRAFVRRKVKQKDMTNWAEIRNAHGNQSAFVDLTFTGRMWQNTGIVDTVRVGNNFITIIGGLDREVKDKLQWNAKRYGTFFIANEEEQKLLAEILENRLTTLIQKAFS